jgi:hypothetical protein
VNREKEKETQGGDSWEEEGSLERQRHPAPLEELEEHFSCARERKRLPSLLR